MHVGADMFRLNVWGNLHVDQVSGVAVPQYFGVLRTSSDLFAAL